ncbi:MAG: response regulator transcription factor [Armatimonadetes bacterium]|nr:response regulator transcription factor [Armatimonadota bacterium]
MNKPIRLLIAEDDSLLRRTLVELLSFDQEFTVVAHVPNGAMALAEIDSARPDVVLTDIEMPKVDGIEATRTIKENHPDLAVVILTKFGDDDSLFRAIRAGASGYVLKDSPIEEIKQAIREANDGESHLNPFLVARVLKEFSRLGERAKERKELFAELSRREMEVLEMLGKGLKNREIADQLFVSEKTVKTHVGAVLKKLHVNDRTEAALLAQKHGIGDE